MNLRFSYVHNTFLVLFNLLDIFIYHILLDLTYVNLGQEEGYGILNSDYTTVR